MGILNRMEAVQTSLVQHDLLLVLSSPATCVQDDHHWNSSRKNLILVLVLVVVLVGVLVLMLFVVLVLVLVLALVLVLVLVWVLLQMLFRVVVLVLVLVQSLVLVLVLVRALVLVLQLVLVLVLVLELVLVMVLVQARQPGSSPALMRQSSKAASRVARRPCSPFAGGATVGSSYSRYAEPPVYWARN